MFIRLFYLLLIISISLLFFSFKTEQSTAQESKIYFNKSLEELQISSNDFLNIVNNYSKINNKNKIIASYKKLRRSFKRAQIIAEHLDHQLFKVFLNGSPLPNIAKDSDLQVVKQPSGLQVIDEILYSANLIEDLDRLKGITSDFNGLIKKLVTFQKTIEFTDRLIIEAIRYDLIRIQSLVISGYETPKSHLAIEDLINNLEAHIEILTPYLNKISNSNSSKQISNYYKGALFVVNKNKDFDTFDRYNFIKNFINPLYKLTLNLHKELNIEYHYEVFSQPISINYKSDNLFSSDFLNKEFYTEVKSTNEKIELGKLLFFDPILSTNIKRACSSCHNPKSYFTDGREKSLALDFNGSVDRNAPVLLYSIFSDSYFYDLRSINLRSQIESVITNPKEFHSDYYEIQNKLNESEEYKKLFLSAFPESNGRISSNSIGFAISSFLSELVFFNSKLDKSMAFKANLNENEIKGFNIFMGKGLCGTCHFSPVFNGLTPPYFTEMDSEVLGVPKKDSLGNLILDDDPGRMKGKVKDMNEIFNRSFKTVTVRNIDKTAPYMHNGVYKSLNEVVDFYNKGGGKGLGYILDNQTLPFDSLNLTAQEQLNLIEFMLTLTDDLKDNFAPQRLPKFKSDSLNKRKIGGEY